MIAFFSSTTSSSSSPVRERAGPFGLERPGHGDLVDRQAELAGLLLIDLEFFERLADVEIRLARGDDAEPLARRVDRRAVETVGADERLHGGQPAVVEPLFDAEQPAGDEADVEAALGHRRRPGLDHAHAVGAHLHRGRALDRVGQALQADPAARIARHRPAVDPEVQVVLNARRVQDRHSEMDERLFALVRDRRRLRARVIAGQGENTAPGRRAGVVGVLDRVARSGRRPAPCRTRCRTRRRGARLPSRFACCDPQTAVAARSSFRPGSKRILALLEERLGLPEGDVVGAER